jgi:hypothetical protein
MSETNKLINEQNSIQLSHFEPNINQYFFMFDFPIINTNLYIIKIGSFIFIIILAFLRIFDKLEGEWENRSKCKKTDPIWMFDKRLEVEHDVICQGKNSTHICYRNTLKSYQSDKGVICKMNNFILDPSKWQDDNSEYRGPIDYKFKGFPLISKGFFNMKCNDGGNMINDINYIYEFYFNSWNYSLYDNNNMFNEIQYEELAPNKTIFFISRNQDSPNLFRGGSEFLNAFSLMKSLSLKPENIQVVFLESLSFDEDPLYDLYKELISRGAPPIHISKLTKPYHISNAIHIPVNWDSPCFIISDVPTCKHQTKTYDLLNKDIKEYMNIPQFYDSIGYDKDIFYYPLTIINPISKYYTKFVTIQWRKVYPRGRTGQQRIIGNGPELAEALAEKLPKNILIRLVDTASLPFKEQIAIMQKTDFLIAEHGSGLFLSIFLPTTAIVQEILHKDNINVLQLMSSLSGHTTYSDIIKADSKVIENNEVLFFDVKQFVRTVLNHMKKNNFNK